MSYANTDSTPFFNPTQARWLAGVLTMLIRIVGPRTCLGVILFQARGEVVSLLADAGTVQHGERLAA